MKKPRSSRPTVQVGVDFDSLAVAPIEDRPRAPTVSNSTVRIGSIEGRYHHHHHYPEDSHLINNPSAHVPSTPSSLESEHSSLRRKLRFIHQFDQLFQDLFPSPGSCERDPHPPNNPTTTTTTVLPHSVCQTGSASSPSSSSSASLPSAPPVAEQMRRLLQMYLEMTPRHGAQPRFQSLEVGDSPALAFRPRPPPSSPPVSMAQPPTTPSPDHAHPPRRPPSLLATGPTLRPRHPSSSEDSALPPSPDSSSSSSSSTSSSAQDDPAVHRSANMAQKIESIRRNARFDTAEAIEKESTGLRPSKPAWNNLPGVQFLQRIASLSQPKSCGRGRTLERSPAHSSAQETGLKSPVHCPRTPSSSSSSSSASSASSSSSGRLAPSLPTSPRNLVNDLGRISSPSASHRMSLQQEIARMRCQVDQWEWAIPHLLAQLDTNGVPQMSPSPASPVGGCPLSPVPPSSPRRTSLGGLGGSARRRSSSTSVVCCNITSSSYPSRRGSGGNTRPILGVDPCEGFVASGSSNSVGPSMSSLNLGLDQPGLALTLGPHPGSALRSASHAQTPRSTLELFVDDNELLEDLHEMAATSAVPSSSSGVVSPRALKPR